MSRRATLACVCALILATGSGAFAQSPPQTPAAFPVPVTIEPDRPDVTNGTHIVETGLLQIEVGWQFTHTTALDHSFGTPTTARIGLYEWLEARVGTDGLLSQTDENGHVVGIGNLQLGAKLRLWADPGGVPVLSILPTVNLPTASAEKGLGSGDADYTIAFLTGTDIGRHWHIDFNYGIGAIGSGGGQPHFAQNLVSVSTSVAASDNWNPYFEGFWYSKQDATTGALFAIDMGAIYELGARFALDGGVQIGLNKDAPAFAAFGGVSMIVGDILGNHGVHERARHAQERAK
jgi:Putative MetA-pathway of phenol degradation